VELDADLFHLNYDRHGVAVVAAAGFADDSIFAGIDDDSF
jgi:hypothetical protein